MKYPNWNEWINKVAEFSISSLKNCFKNRNTIHYIVSFWSRLVNSATFTKVGDSFKVYVKAVSEAYILSRFRYMEQLVKEGQEDLFDLEEEYDLYPHVARFSYADTKELLKTYVKEQVEALRNASGDHAKFIIGNLAVIVSLISCIINGRFFLSSSEESDNIDSEITAECLKVMMLTQEFNGPIASTMLLLESAYLSFMKSCKEVFLANTSSTHNSFLPSDNEMFDFFVKKIFSLLARSTNDVNFTKKVLGLLHNFATDSCMDKELQAKGIVQELLSNGKYMSLNVPASLMKSYYKNLGKLVFNETNFQRFYDFITPFDKMLSAVSHCRAEELRSSQNKQLILGFLHAMCGLALSADQHLYFAVFFDWISSASFSLLVSVANAFPDVPEVVNPLITLLMILSENKLGRNSFQQFSTTGVVLFREIAKIIEIFAKTYQKISVQKDLYIEKIKPVHHIVNV